MTPSSAPLLTALLNDAALLAGKKVAAAEALAAHAAHRNAWFAGLLGPLVVLDSRLAAVSRVLANPDASAAADRPVGVGPAGSSPVEGRPLDGLVDVSVVLTGGAGGLISLAKRDLPGVMVVAVESTLRDLDDLSGNAARVVAAAEELDHDVRVFVEIPFAPGWERAVTVVEAAGRYAKIRTGDEDPAAVPPAEHVARRLSVLIEADLPFSVAAGRLRPAAVVDSAAGGAVQQHGFLSILTAIDALIDGADERDAAHLLAQPAEHSLAREVSGWDDARAARVRRRLVSVGGWGVREFVDDLARLGLVIPPR